MPQLPEKTDKMDSIWQIVSLDGFHPPPAPTRDVATKGIIKFWRLFRKSQIKPDSPEKKKEELERISLPLLSEIVPAIDWNYGAEALDTHLNEWLNQCNQNSFIRLFIGPPFCGHVDCLKLWAVARETPIIEPPTTEQILDSDESWLEKVAQFKKPWVFPNLEKSYLRHSDGLYLIRRFLERAFSGQLGAGVIGCESWAWSFLQKAWSVPTSDLWTLQAFNAEKLSIVFRELAKKFSRIPIRFRESANGKEVLSTNATTTEEASPSSPFLVRLASHSRGNLGLAWHYWRTSLYAEPEGAKGTESDSTSNNRSFSENTFWVRDFFEETTVPSGSDYEVAFILHFLLLHGQLSVDLLLRLIPFSQGIIMATLLNLMKVGIVEKIENDWRVSALGYPAARQFLKSNGYLVDSF
jgi:hypothetical protein